MKSEKHCNFLANFFGVKNHIYVTLGAHWTVGLGNKRKPTRKRRPGVLREIILPLLQVLDEVNRKKWSTASLLALLRFRRYKSDQNQAQGNHSKYCRLVRSSCGSEIQQKFS
jgi:hypothetical protein